MRFLLLALAVACAERRLPPTFPEKAAGQPVVSEQALLGLSDAGDAAVAQLIDAEGTPPELTLAIFDHGGAPGKTVETASAKVARAVAERVKAAGHRPSPILGAALAAEWPEAAARAETLGFFVRSPASPEPGRRRWLLAGTPSIGSLPLSLRLIDTDSDPRALVLMLSERPAGTTVGEEIELTRMTLAGVAVAPELWVTNNVAWLLSGSFLPGDGPLHRAVGVRRGSLARAEAQLHDAHGLADYSAGDLDAARREFDRAIAADPGFVDALYNAAAAAALSDRNEEAVAFLRRAVEKDPARVQVLGRNDDDLKILRKRADVRALLGLHRLPPDNVAQPP